MEFISFLLSLFGLGRDAQSRIVDRRNEIARLNSEVAGEVGRALDTIAMATPRLLHRCVTICPEDPSIGESCAQMLATLRSQAEALTAQAAELKQQIDAEASATDWDKLLRDLHEWRATATRLCPWVEAVIKRFDDALDEEQARRAGGSGHA